VALLALSSSGTSSSAVGSVVSRRPVGKHQRAKPKQNGAHLLMFCRSALPPSYFPQLAAITAKMRTIQWGSYEHLRKKPEDFEVCQNGNRYKHV
jgi:hypothetical protein